VWWWLSIVHTREEYSDSGILSQHRRTSRRNARPGGPVVSLAERRAAAWARDVIELYGRPDEHDVWLVPVTQAELAQRMGWARNSGTVGTYLATLGPVVRQRRGGIVFDEHLLVQMESRLAQATAATGRSDEIARDLAMRMGQPTAHGTVLMAGTGPKAKPASLADMATLLGIHRSTVLQHLRRLAKDGRLHRAAGAWIFPPDRRQSSLPHSQDTMDWARHKIGPVATNIAVATRTLRQAGAELTEAIDRIPDEVPEPHAQQRLRTDFETGLNVVNDAIRSLEVLLKRPQDSQ
jgi:hypothetical protein